MSFNLVDSVKGLFTNDLTARMASSFGESEGGIQKAVGIEDRLVAFLNDPASQGGKDVWFGRREGEITYSRALTISSHSCSRE